ncbi:MAG: hypothetical protein ACQGVK_06105 [Myxococcota bacterium]
MGIEDEERSVNGNVDQGGRSRPRIGWTAALGLAWVAALAAGCASDTFGTREEARPLVPGKWHRDFLHCEKHECKDWYMVNVDRKVELRIDVYSAAVPGLPDYILRLENSNRRQIAKVDATGQSPRQLRKQVDAGLYLLLIESADPKGIRLEYEVLAELRDPPKPRRRAAPRTPRPREERPVAPMPRVQTAWVDAEVLEVERDAGEPAYVLIDAGKPKGVRAGHTGQLVQGGQTIAEIEVTEVYDAGSRARIVGPLQAAITIETKAKIAVPRTER